MPIDNEPLLKVDHVTKQFAGVKALDKVDLTVFPGEIHALLGENGAGKSTLIKILSGMYVADEGQVFFKGNVVNPSTQSLSISFIHQDLGLIDTMTVGENVAIVAGYQRLHGLISWRHVNRRAREILRSMGSYVDPEVKVGALDAAEKAIVGIARALAVEADLLVLDEPTASLSEADVSRLLNILKQLKGRNLGIIFVTHRIDEVFRIADTVTILRDGKQVATIPITHTDVSDLVEKITGRSVSDTYVAPPTTHGSKSNLQVKELSAMRVEPVSFSIAEGEVLGLVGVRGAGHEVIGRIIFGDIPARIGSIDVNGSPVTIRNCATAVRYGIGYISSKRIDDNLAGLLSVRENLFLNPGIQMDTRRFIRRQGERDKGTDLMQKFSVRPPGCEHIIMTLSGGNQQKVILARWLSLNIKVLILEEPTSGVDVGAKAEIYRILNTVLKAGLSILLISSDYEEVTKLSHRALVFNRGRVVAEVSRRQLSVQALTSLATGTEFDSNLQIAEGEGIVK